MLVIVGKMKWLWPALLVFYHAMVSGKSLPDTSETETRDSYVIAREIISKVHCRTKYGLFSRETVRKRCKVTMNHDFSCCSLGSVQEGVKRKVYPKARFHKMACSMVYIKSKLMNVYKTWLIS